ncbi:MAG: hypothetical protein O3B04_09705 [Chloroflexi bacterium]|nr:hypothetical protein [Chloroflexota bacterium]
MTPEENTTLAMRLIDYVQPLDLHILDNPGPATASLAYTFHVPDDSIGVVVGCVCDERKHATLLPHEFGERWFGLCWAGMHKQVYLFIGCACLLYPRPHWRIETYFESGFTGFGLITAAL